MRRRKETEDPTNNPVPVKLRRFVPAEWPGETEWRQYEAWWGAHCEWGDLHPDVDMGPWTEEIGDIPWDPAIDPV